MKSESKPHGTLHGGRENARSQIPPRPLPWKKDRLPPQRYACEQQKAAGVTSASFLAGVQVAEVDVVACQGIVDGLPRLAELGGNGTYA